MKNEELVLNGKAAESTVLEIAQKCADYTIVNEVCCSFDPKNYSVYTINFAGGKVRVGHVRGHMSMVLSWPSISFAH